MATLKDMLRQALRDSRKNKRHSDANLLFDSYQNEFNKIVGKAVLWKAYQNPIFKNAQLVLVVKAYPRFVLVKKIAYSVDGSVSELFYGVSFSSIIEGKESVELLEDK